LDRVEILGSPEDFTATQGPVKAVFIARLPRGRNFDAARTANGRNACMTPLTTLITPDGDWVAPGSAEFHTMLGDSAPDYDSVAFAIKNLGFIQLKMFDKSIIEVELCPRNVELPALLVAQQQVQSAPVGLYRIKYFDADWRSEISSSAERTISRLSELCAPVFTQAPTDRFLVEPRDLSVLFDNEENQLRPLAQKWRASFGHFDPSVISVAVDHGLLSRLMIAGVKPRKSDPIWRFIGEGHKWIGGQYLMGGIGEKVEYMPDKDYGAWATHYYKSVAHTGQPRYDLITGSIHYEDETGKPLKLIRYERLLLPWRTPTDEVFVTMCSRLVDAANAEPKSADPPLAPSPSTAIKFAKSS
jgi:hypothetical protein